MVWTLILWIEMTLYTLLFQINILIKHKSIHKFHQQTTKKNCNFLESSFQNLLFRLSLTYFTVKFRGHDFISKCRNWFRFLLSQHLFPTLPYKPNRASDLNLYMFIAALPSLIAKLLKFAHFLRTKFHSHITKTLEVYQHWFHIFASCILLS